MVWEDAQIGVGNVVNISGEDVFINATIRCSVNQGSEASILMINEEESYMYAELPREFCWDRSKFIGYAMCANRRGKWLYILVARILWK